MRNVIIRKEILRNGAQIAAREKGMSLLKMRAEGSGIDMTELLEGTERYLSFYLEGCETHSMVLSLRAYTTAEGTEPDFEVKFGILPGVRTPVCIDRRWMDAHVLFPEAQAGGLKMVCHGRRVEEDEIVRLVLETLPVFHDVEIRITDPVLEDSYPVFTPLPEEKLVDALGQNKRKSWAGKTKDAAEMKARLEQQMQQAQEGYPFADWSAYGGWQKKKLAEGTGFFTRYQAEGRWWLADPEGNAFFSMGPDCVIPGTDCRVDGVEKWLDWLPEKSDPVYGEMFRQMKFHASGEKSNREGVLFSYTQANLRRALGANWYPAWQKLISSKLRSFGMNTLGNWSDEKLFGTARMPYVTSLPQFPETKQKIFRDFPDVCSEEYVQEAKRCAQALETGKDDPWMIGYFLRNEPAWAFVNNLILADEMLYNPADTACKEALIAFLQEKYGDIGTLNAAYHAKLTGFDALRRPQKRVSSWSDAAHRDMKEFSAQLLRAYVEIPCRACRQVDRNHMILGMRWAWISDPDLVTGWENFDVFSINCYALDPTEHIERVRQLGVNLPVMIGEFHFGALDAGPSATGLKAVHSQKERGMAYRYYCERAARHPYGVGCHYFQCYDQFVLGRFDGENYNIGLFDVCSRPYSEMMEQVKMCSSRIYEVAAQTLEATEEKAELIPMIAF